MSEVYTPWYFESMFFVVSDVLSACTLKECNRAFSRILCVFISIGVTIFSLINNTQCQLWA